MNYEDFINTPCHIKPLDVTGTILAILITKRGTEYQVRYYLHGEQKTDYFFDWEIKTMKDKDESNDKSQQQNAFFK